MPVPRALLLFGLLAGVVRPLGSAAATEQPGRQRDGDALYLRYCSACHGAAADGNGMVAPELRRPPADLRALWRHYGTPLDVDQVTRFVDGRARVIAHGDSSMPVWGRRLKQFGDLDAPEEIEIRETLRAIVLYLEGVQDRP